MMARAGRAAPPAQPALPPAFAAPLAVLPLWNAQASESFGASVKSLAVLVLVPIALGVTQAQSSVQAPAASMSPGATQNIEYENEFLGRTYPLSPEWVREPLQEHLVTGANSQQVTPGVLLAAVHVPATNFPIVDSSLTRRLAAFPA